MKKRSYGFPRTIRMLIALCIMTAAFGSTAYAKKGDEALQTRAKKIAEAAGTEQVKTIQWVAKVTASKKVKKFDGTGKVAVKAGVRVTVIQRDYHQMNGISECRTSGGVLCWIPNRMLTFEKPICTGAKKDYSRETKEAFVNGAGVAAPIKPTKKSPVKNTLIWVSLDKQRVNIFKGKKGKWKLVRTCKCSTGTVDAPTFDQTFVKFYNVRRKDRFVNYGENKGLQYFLNVYGYGIHKWPGSGMKKSLGKEPASHSCIRLKTKDAKWCFKNKNVPVKTRVYVW